MPPRLSTKSSFAIGTGSPPLKVVGSALGVKVLLLLLKEFSACFLRKSASNFVEAPSEVWRRVPDDYVDCKQEVAQILATNNLPYGFGVSLYHTLLNVMYTTGRSTSLPFGPPRCIIRTSYITSDPAEQQALTCLCLETRFAF